MRNPMFLILFLKLSYGFIYVNIDNFEIRYTVTFENVCHSEEDRFRFMLESSIAQCVKECGTSSHCEALNFRSKVNVCELFSTSKADQLSKGDCRHVAKDDINVLKSPCDRPCKHGEVCENNDERKGKCIIKECVNTTIPEHGTILGNQREVGKKIRYRCDKGYKQNNAVHATVAECLDTGVWNDTAECVPIERAWANWMDWGLCSVTCGGGKRTRARVCSIPSESTGETPCQADDPSEEEEACNPETCPTIGQGCESDTDCTETAGTCIGKHCFCNRLYRYNTTIRDCVKVCESMSTDFEEFAGDVISGYNDIAWRDKFDTVDDCLNACVDHNDCLSIDLTWRQGEVQCNMGSVTREMILDAVPKKLINYNGYTLYTRKCN